ncbi:transporter substrate-binding domain-containing protein [Thalassotalea sp. G2M2-11]|uniref:substrate-binding periplasmic protein n=1 Tax=Thalassotalea sp. G2M2-11 TaxID=2787627 RepID=UPI0019D2890A|nr:transporter substrate-binding domain-containing protein [Thalassotalea sp. G2M2-11]
MKQALKTLLFYFGFIFSIHAETAVTKIDIVAPHLPPLIEKNEHGKLTGRFVDALMKVEQHSSLDFNIQVVPWARAIKLAKNNLVDGIMPVLQIKEREQFLAFPEQELINFTGSVVIKRHDDAFIFNGFDALTSVKRIGKVRAMSLGHHFDKAQLNPLVEVSELTRLEDALNMLLLKRLDLVVSDALVADEVISKMPNHTNFSIMAIANTKEPSYLAFSKQFAKQHDINAIMSLINQYNDPSYYLKKLLPH